MVKECERRNVEETENLAMDMEFEPLSPQYFFVLRYSNMLCNRIGLVPFFFVLRFSNMMCNRIGLVFKCLCFVFSLIKGQYICSLYITGIQGPLFLQNL